MISATLPLPGENWRFCPRTVKWKKQELDIGKYRDWLTDRRRENGAAQYRVQKRPLVQMQEKIFCGFIYVSMMYFANLESHLTLQKISAKRLRCPEASGCPIYRSPHTYK
jgi:hypothetical protein